MGEWTQFKLKDDGWMYASIVYQKMRYHPVKKRFQLLIRETFEDGPLAEHIARMTALLEKHPEAVIENEYDMETRAAGVEYYQDVDRNHPRVIEFVREQRDKTIFNP